MTTVSTSVKWAVSSMTGAPTLNGTAGSMIALLDAFLVNGFGTKAVDSAQVTSGICRMAITGASAAQDHSVIQLAGVTGSGVTLNGLQRVKAATASYVEFPCDLPDGPLTGTITFKIAPLGWEKVFSKTNVAVYRSADPAGTRAYYRVDDTNPLYARVTMYESMTDVDTGVGMGPAASVVSGGYYWHKRSAAGAHGVAYELRGDGQGFYLSVASNAATTPTVAGSYAFVTQYAGDIKSDRSGDAWCAHLTGAVTTNYTDVSGDPFQEGASAGRTLMRASHGIGGAIAVSRLVWGGGMSGAVGTLGAFPSRVNNGLRLLQISVSDGAVADGPRGMYPGALFCPQSGVSAAVAGGFLQTLAPSAEAQSLSAVAVGVPSGAAAGVGFFDVTNPWRA